MDDDEITIVHYNKNVRTKEPTPTRTPTPFSLTQIEIYSFYRYDEIHPGEL